MKIEGSANFTFCDKLFQSNGDLTCLHDKNSEWNNSIHAQVIVRLYIRLYFGTCSSLMENIYIVSSEAWSALL